MDVAGRHNPKADRPLESALLITFFVHGLAMLSMALLLLPGMPGGTAATELARVSYVAAHPWIWRAGWLPWQLTALSDLLLAIALVRTRWIPKPPAIFTLLVTVAALFPDQISQARWTWVGPRLAADAIRLGNLNPYLKFESIMFRAIAGYATIGYVAGAIGWSWCFAAADVWSRRLTWLSMVTWGLFIASTAILFLSVSVRVIPGVQPAVSAGNAIAFVLLMWWYLLATERVLRRSRLETAHGRLAAWRYPVQRFWSPAIDWFANSRFVRAIGEYLPVFSMASDITDVVYVNYLVDAATLLPLVPAGLRLQRLGPNRDRALVTFLTFRHGHFGPVIFGPFRRWWPSPIQSNWRIYVTDSATDRDGVLFITTAITSTPHALASRVLCEGVPMHVPFEAAIEKQPDGSIQVWLDPGTGSGPQMDLRLRPSDKQLLPESWNSCFESFEDFLQYCVPQDRALDWQPWYDRISRQEIDLVIPLASCVQLEGQVESTTAIHFVGDAKPICFGVDRVSFRFSKQLFSEAATVQ